MTTRAVDGSVDTDSRVVTAVPVEEAMGDAPGFVSVVSRVDESDFLEHVALRGVGLGIGRPGSALVPVAVALGVGGAHLVPWR